MSSPLRVAKLIHDALTVANMNAWHYWWVYDSNTGLFTSGGNPTKRLWVEGNYARFVRPGYQRVGTTGTAPSGVLLSAFANPTDGTLVVVAVNDNAGSTPVSLYVSGTAPCSGHALGHRRQQQPGVEAGGRRVGRTVLGHAGRPERDHLRRQALS